MFDFFFYECQKSLWGFSFCSNVVVRKISRNFPPWEISAGLKSLCVGVLAFVGYFQCQKQSDFGGVLCTEVW